MTSELRRTGARFTTKDYVTVGLSTLALILSGASFYFQVIEKSYALYVGISDVGISLDAPMRPYATFLFANRGNQQAIVLRLTADIYPAAESFSTDNCTLPQIQRIASLKWVISSSASGALQTRPILLKPADIEAYNVTFSDLSQNDIARAVAAGHGNKFLLMCWAAVYYSKDGYIIIRHFAETVTEFDEFNQVKEQRTPTSLVLLPQ